MRLGIVCAFVLVLAVGATEGAGKGPQPVLAYAGEGPTGSLDIFVTTVGDARRRRLTGSTRNEFSPSWSPDGRWIAYRVNPPRGDTGDIWVMRADGTGKRNLTRTPNVADWSPAFSPDGTRIAFFSALDVWIMRSDGTGRRNVTRNGALNEYPNWSPDGRHLAFNSHRDGQYEIYRSAVTGKQPRNLTRSSTDDEWPAWSHDGRHIAFMSERDGNEDVFVMRADGSEVRNLTRTPELEESHPAWMPDGRLSFTRHGETGPIELWAVAPDGTDAERLETSAEPVFVFAWKPSR